MPALVRRIGLALAALGFTFQTAVAASLRCEIAMAAPVPAGEHGGGHHHGEEPSSQSHAPMHCICAVGCHQTTVPVARSVTLPAEPRPVDRPVVLESKTPFVPLVARRGALPPAIAPPSLS